jgi:hypothetical protein
VVAGWVAAGILAVFLVLVVAIIRPAEEAMGQELLRVRDERDEARYRIEQELTRHRPCHMSDHPVEYLQVLGAPGGGIPVHDLHAMCHVCHVSLPCPTWQTLDHEET